MRKLALKIGMAMTAMMPASALAVARPPSDIVTSGTDLEDLLATVGNWFFTIFLLVAIIFLIWSAFLYLTAAGDGTKVTKAKTALIYSIVGIAVALLAGGLTQLVENILKIAPLRLSLRASALDLLICTQDLLHHRPKIRRIEPQRCHDEDERVEHEFEYSAPESIPPHFVEHAIILLRETH